MNLKDSLNIKTHVLSNGLRVALVPFKNSDIISMNLAYRVGSKNEERNRTGLAHLFEHLMFEGSKNIPKGDFDKLCSLAGGTNNAYTTYDVTAYTITIPSNQIETALWLESDRMLEFSVTQSALETQQKVVSEEIRQTVFDRPYGKWRRLLAENSFHPDCSYSWEVHGSIEDVMSADLEYLEMFFNKYYRPGNAILTLCGDVDENKLLQLIEKYFSEIQNHTTDVEDKHFNESWLLKNKSVVFEDKVPLPAVFINFHIPGFSDDDIYKAEILSNIASSGRSSRLYSKLVEKLQIASTVGSFVDKREDSSIITFYGIPTDSDTDKNELKSKMYDIILNLSKFYVTNFELEKNINQLTTAVAHEIQYSSGIADMVSTNLLFNDDKDRIYSVLDKYKSISDEELKKFAGEYIQMGREIEIECLPEPNKSA